MGCHYRVTFASDDPEEKESPEVEVLPLESATTNLISTALLDAVPTLTQGDLKCVVLCDNVSEWADTF